MFSDVSSRWECVEEKVVGWGGVCFLDGFKRGFSCGDGRYWRLVGNVGGLLEVLSMNGSVICFNFILSLGSLVFFYSKKYKSLNKLNKLFWKSLYYWIFLI